MRVIYTQAAKLAGAGIGSIAYQHVKGLHECGFLRKAIIAYEGQHHLPKTCIQSFLWMRLVARLARDNHPIRDAIFDAAAARYITECDLFHGWSQQCIHSLKKAKQRGAVTFVERQNSHNRNQYELVQGEFDKWGFKGYRAIRPRGMERGLAEYETADYISVPSKFVYDSFLREGFEPERLFLIPYGVDIEMYKPDSDKIKKNNAFRLLFVGQVSLRKGVPYLLQAWQRLKLPDSELWLAGRIVPDAEMVIQPYLKESSIKFLNHVQHVETLYNQVDAFVLPSIEEGSALVTYEAMASGLPLIFTANTGTVARNKKEGLEVPIRDSEGLAQAIEQLYEDKSLRHKLGQAGRKRAEEFTWQKAVQKLIKAYQSVLES